MIPFPDMSFRARWQRRRRRAPGILDRGRQMIRRGCTRGRAATRWPRCRSCGSPVTVYPFGPRQGQPAQVCSPCLLAGLLSLLEEDEEGDD